MVLGNNLSRAVVSLALVVMATGLASAAELAPSSTKSPDDTVRLQHCLITAVDDVQVSAQQAGPIVTMHAKEGKHVDRDEPVAELDSDEAKLQVQETQANFQVSRVRAVSPLEVDYAVATHRTAEQEHKIAVSVNEKEANAVSALEVERLRLAAEQAFIKIAVARQEQEIHGHESAGTDAKAKMAEVILRQHTIRAPVEGEIVELYIRQGEWVEKGKPVLRIVRLDRLRVEGFVKTRDLLPHEILGKPVRIEVELARGQKISFDGQVTFVSPLVQPGGDYRVWAEVDNRRAEGQWLLRPGLEAEMTIGK
jgi:macrolide-specific efflux system membrane fusion protein